MARTFTNTTGQRIQIGTASFATTDDVCIGCWIFVTAFNNGVDARVISKAVSTTSADHRWMLGFTNPSGSVHNLRTRMRWSSGGGPSVTTLVGTTDLALAHGSKWIHIMASFPRGTGTVELFLDGTSDGTAATASNRDFEDTATEAVIGNSHDNAGATSAPSAHVAWAFAAKANPTANERTALARGVPPWRVFPGRLMHCFPLWGDHSPEINLQQGGTSGTIQGTIARHHGGPPVLFPFQWRMPPFLEEVAAAGGLSIPVAMHSYRQRRIA